MITIEKFQTENPTSAIAKQNTYSNFNNFQLKYKSLKKFNNKCMLFCLNILFFQNLELIIDFLLENKREFYNKNRHTIFYNLL